MGQLLPNRPKLNLNDIYGNDEVTEFHITGTLDFFNQLSNKEDRRKRPLSKLLEQGVGEGSLRDGQQGGKRGGQQGGRRGGQQGGQQGGQRGGQQGGRQGGQQGGRRGGQQGGRRGGQQ